MGSWLTELKYDPIPPLLAGDNPALRYFVKRDLIEESVGSIQSLWDLPEPKKILSKQLLNGAWPDKSAKRHINSPTNYELLETFRNLRVLVQMYGFDKSHLQIQYAANYIFSIQSDEGDFRGIYGNQYCSNYCAAILEMLVRAGYHDESQIQKAFRWFLDTQMHDGGWVLPMQTAHIKMPETEEIMRQPTISIPKKSTISAHSITGIVIRAFGQHPTYCHHLAAQNAASFLMQRFFKPDKYSSRQSASYWTKYTFPYWWADLVGVLDALSLMDILNNTPGIVRAFNYYKQQQRPDGTWRFSKLATKKISEVDLWLAFTLCRIFKRFYQKNPNY